MSHPSIRRILVVCVLTITGCGGGTNTPGGGNGATGALTIAVDHVAEPLAIGSAAPASGRRFVEVDATLTNPSGAGESIAFALFAVQTATGLRVQASAATSQLAHACAADQSLAPGGTTMCSLAFELPTAETATTLAWLDPLTMASSTAALPEMMTPTLESACNQTLALKNGSSSACTSCTGASCTPATSACTSAEYSCVANCTMGSMICPCMAACTLGDACRQQLIDTMQCKVTTCGAQCS